MLLRSHSYGGVITDILYRPYIALCRGLIAEGHTATIVTHNEYKEWIEGFGVRHRAAGGDPGALMKLSVEHSVRDWRVIIAHGK